MTHGFEVPPGPSGVDELVLQLREENARLRADLAEAEARESATGEVLKTISRSAFDVQPVLEILVENAARLCNAEKSYIFKYHGEFFRFAAQWGGNPATRNYMRTYPPIPWGPGSTVGRAAIERRTVHIHDVLKDPEYGLLAQQQALGYRTALGVPMFREGRLVGVFVLTRDEVDAFTAKQIDLVETFADQAAIALANSELFRELADRNRELTETLSEQTATSEILRVIASSPADLEAALDAVAESAARLCKANEAQIFRIDGDVLRHTAAYGPSGKIPSVDAIPIGRGSLGGRAVLERRTIHVHDLAAESDSEFPVAKAMQRRLGHRTLLVVPLLREGAPIGILSLARPVVQPFSEKEVHLLESFADQAAIAMGNVRMFRELEARSAELARSVEQLRALGDVSQVVSSTLDLQSVLTTVLSHADELSGADGGAIYAYDQRSETFQLRATRRFDALLTEALLATPIQLGEGAVGRAAIDRQPLQMPDMLVEGAYQGRLREVIAQAGYRAVLAVPLLWEDRVLGGLALVRKSSGEFSPDVVKLVETFASHSALAMRNARLFEEIGERRRELEQLYRLAVALQEPSTLEERLTLILGTLQQVVGFERAAIWLPTADDRFLEAAAWIGFDLVESDRILVPLEGGVPSLTKAYQDRVEVVLEAGPVADSLRAPEPYASYSLIRARNLAVLPLIARGRGVGVLAVDNARSHRPIAPRLELLRIFAANAAVAIENARLFEEIARKSQQLEVASQHKSEFLANMSHELRTPLNAIIGFSQVLADQLFGPLNAKQEEYVQDIVDSGGHLVSLINDILDLSKVEAGRMELELARFSLAEALNNGLTMVRERAARHGIVLGREVDPAIGVVEADERKVKQVIFNLLANAVKFTPDGGRVDLAARLVGDEIHVTVRDTGVGIAPEDQARIFEDFQQVGRNSTGSHEGTGLGLALARRFVELHGGRLWVDSQVGVGSTFTFSLPARTSAAATGQPLTGMGRGSIVLVVEDNPQSIELLTLYLRADGLDVAVAHDGEEALALARQLRPAAIVLDILLPRLDGWDVLARAKADPTLAHIPVIIVSMLDERGKGFALGAAEYLVKPVSRDEVIGALRRVRLTDPIVPGAARVLAIDDDPMALELIEAILRPEGYMVLKATGGAEGIALARRELPALVILDLLMPEVDGFSVVEQLRADPATASIPIVLLTSRSMRSEDKQRLNGHISYLARKAEFNRAAFVELVSALCPRAIG